MADGSQADWEIVKKMADRYADPFADIPADWPDEANQQAHEDLDIILEGNPGWNRDAMHGLLDEMARGTGRDDLSITFGSEELDDGNVPAELNLQSGDKEYTRKSGGPAIATGGLAVTENEQSYTNRLRASMGLGDIGLTQHVTDDAELQQSMRQPKAAPQSNLERILGQSFRVMSISTSHPDDEEKFPSSIVIQYPDGSTSRLYSGESVPGRPGVIVGEIGYHARPDWKERPRWDQMVHGVEFATPGSEGESVVMTTTSGRDEQPRGAIFDYGNVSDWFVDWNQTFTGAETPQRKRQRIPPTQSGIDTTITGGAIIEKFAPMMKARKDLFERAEEAGYDLSDEDVKYMGDFLVLGRPAYAFEGNAAGSYDGDNVFAVYPDGKIDEFSAGEEWPEVSSPGTPE